jgi:hypothetical protein
MILYSIIHPTCLACIILDLIILSKLWSLLCNHLFPCHFVGFEALRVVVMKNPVFWDIMPCSPFKVTQHFGGTCHLHLQDWRISQAELATQFTLVSCGACSSTLNMEVTCLKHWLTLNRLHGLISLHPLSLCFYWLEYSFSGQNCYWSLYASSLLAGLKLKDVLWPAWMLWYFTCVL